MVTGISPKQGGKVGSTRKRGKSPATELRSSGKKKICSLQRGPQGRIGTNEAGVPTAGIKCARDSSVGKRTVGGPTRKGGRPQVQAMR